MIVDLRHSTLPALGAASRPLIDGQGRRIHHLRLSVISACNLRCIYCKPQPEGKGVRVLSDTQRVQFVRYLHQQHALTQVRVTGGEPLLYPRLLTLIESLRTISPTLVLAMTTNAQGLAECAADLRSAGLDRLNISIDTLDPRRYRSLTGGELQPVLDGIDAAMAAGFPPPKLNSVVLRGENDDDLTSLVHWAFARGCEMRFLEAMPIGPAAEINRRLFVSADEIYAKLAADFDLKPLGLEFGATALRFRATARCFGKTSANDGAASINVRQGTGGMGKLGLPVQNPGSTNELRSPMVSNVLEDIPGSVTRAEDSSERLGDRGRVGVVGLVAPMTKPFCGSCGRVRLTSDGKLYPCLLDDRFADLRPAWSDDTFDAELASELIHTVIRDKRPEGAKRQSAAMVSLGG